MLPKLNWLYGKSRLGQEKRLQPIMLSLSGILCEGLVALVPLPDAEAVAEHNCELGHGSGPLALGILPVLFEPAQDQIQ
jgi:hypothetical protein